MNSFRTSLALTALLASTILSGSAFANLIPVGPIPTAGSGLGAVNTSMTFQNAGTEIGAVGLLPGGGGVQIIGSRVAFGIPGFPSVGTETNETAGNAGTNLFTASALGLAAGSAMTFSNLVVLFNGNEGGNVADLPITLSNLALNLFSSTGSLLGSFTTASPYTLSSFQGVGTAGYGFQLDASQAAQANAFLLSNPNLVIGTAARATGANGGPETISLSTLPGTVTSVPDTGGTVALLGLGLLAVAGISRRFGI